MDELHMQRLAALADMALERSELRVLLPHITACVTSLLPATAASLLLWDDTRETFTVSSSTVPGQREGYVLRSVRGSGGASRWIVDEQQPVAVNDIEHDPFGASSMMRDAELRAYLGVPMLFEGQSVGVLYALEASVRDYSRTDIDFMTILARRAASAIGLARLFEQVEALARTDDLTGLDNRREFMAKGQTEFERESRSQRPLSAVVIDVDRFKAINDGFGHAVGDQVLIEIARRVRAELRGFDIVGRLGGEEFAVLLPEVARTVAGRIAERIRAAVSSSSINVDRRAIDVTITLGVAERTALTVDLAGLLDRADTALYDGKAAGRNRVVTLDETGPIRHGSSSLGSVPPESSEGEPHVGR